MQGTTTKTRDGKAAEQGFRHYLLGHGKAPHANLMGATERRRAAACEALGISIGEYNARAERFVNALLARHRDLADRPYVRTLAFAYVSHVAVRQAERRAALKREATRLLAQAEAALFRAGLRSCPAPSPAPAAEPAAPARAA